MAEKVTPSPLGGSEALRERLIQRASELDEFPLDAYRDTAELLRKAAVLLQGEPPAPPLVSTVIERLWHLDGEVHSIIRMLNMERAPTTSALSGSWGQNTEHPDRDDAPAAHGEPPAPAISELVTCSLRDPDHVVHRPRLDCQHEAPHLIAACGAFKGEPPAPARLPSHVAIVQREAGGVQIEGHTPSQDWELEIDESGRAVNFDCYFPPALSVREAEGIGPHEEEKQGR